ncbi:hypothetical protein HDE_12875 [Halotydeus destructor]|nr:hypothetical protein HDE_12875 [Halotydeus destructor]
MKPNPRLLVTFLFMSLISAVYNTTCRGQNPIVCEKPSDQPDTNLPVTATSIRNPVNVNYEIYGYTCGQYDGTSSLKKKAKLVFGANRVENILLPVTGTLECLRLKITDCFFGDIKFGCIFLISVPEMS